MLLFRHLPKLQACLESSDVNYRIAVGETIALLVELGRDMDEVRNVFSGHSRPVPRVILTSSRGQLQQFEVEDSEGLCQCLKSLATDGNKHRAKTDRRKQRSIFREVLHYIEVRPRPPFRRCILGRYPAQGVNAPRAPPLFSPQRDEFTEETIKFGETGLRTEQRFHIDNWMKRRSYDAFRQLMESGVREHLKVRTQSPLFGGAGAAFFKIF